jgi:hypothetical protein
MASTMLQLDYTNVLTAAVGPAHGLTLAEIKRAQQDVRKVVIRIERERKDGQHRSKPPSTGSSPAWKTWWCSASAARRSATSRCRPR